jgi:predicted nuclease of predicted toxin-antitoxin system
MARFLIDANLPRRLAIWASAEFEYVTDIDPAMSDRNIWDYAKPRNLTVVTKDADFTDLALLRPGEVRVIHFRIGNMKSEAFEEFLERSWDIICAHNADHQIVTVFEDHVDCISE